MPTARDSIMVRVADVDSHCERSRRAAARIIADRRDFPYGQRLGQSIADRAP
ncbi:MAG TPA: hypothetical protein VG371_06850 [Solirubrobacteraceae bacterium]|nr:hypothetical protein [Solirubrobacteraceae bacterium]